MSLLCLRIIYKMPYMVGCLLSGWMYVYMLKRPQKSEMYTISVLYLWFNTSEKCGKNWEDQFTYYRSDPSKFTQSCASWEDDWCRTVFECHVQPQSRTSHGSSHDFRTTISSPLLSSDQQDRSLLGSFLWYVNWYSWSFPHFSEVLNHRYNADMVYISLFWGLFNIYTYIQPDRTHPTM